MSGRVVDSVPASIRGLESTRGEPMADVLLPRGATVNDRMEDSPEQWARVQRKSRVMTKEAFLACVRDSKMSEPMLRACFRVMCQDWSTTAAAEEARRMDAHGAPVRKLNASHVSRAITLIAGRRVVVDGRFVSRAELFAQWWRERVMPGRTERVEASTYALNGRDERMVVELPILVAVADFRQDLREWLDARDFQNVVFGPSQFGAEMKARGLVSVQNEGAVYYTGVRLRERADGPYFEAPAPLPDCKDADSA